MQLIPLHPAIPARRQHGAAAEPTRRARNAWLWEALTVALLFWTVTLTWCDYYHRSTRESWSVPPFFTTDKQWPRWQSAFYGDAFWTLATIKASADGEVAFLDKQLRSLGAPFHANWNDWPTTDEALIAWTTFLARIFGVFRGSNVALLSAHLLAAASFYLVCRYLSYSRLAAFVGASLFALSRYAFWRGLPHLSLTFYWHVPLALLVSWWCLREAQLLREKRKLLICIGVAVLHGAQNPYYAAIFLQLLACAALVSIAGRRGFARIMPPLLIGAVVLVTAALMNVDTLCYRLTHGVNREVIARSHADVQVGALKPVELFIPSAHTISKIENWAKERYYTKALFVGEGGAPYLGIIGTLAILLLLLAAMRNIARSDLDRVPVHFWGILCILAYSVTGALTAIPGLWDFFYLRAANRFSIVILAAALLFLVKQLSLLTRSWPIWATLPLSIALVAIGVRDQASSRPGKQERATKEMISQDEQLVQTMEAKLPSGAMVFQLPLMTFPEPTPVANMVEYEPLRPYLHAHHLRFSYGDDKGRLSSAWQTELDLTDARTLAATLEKYGFSALLINRKGYDEGGAAFLDNLRAAGKERVLASSPDFICLELNPWREPLTPPEFTPDWYPLERNTTGSFHWSRGDATFVLHNSSDKEQSVRLTFALKVAGDRYVTISAHGQTLYEGQIYEQERLRTVDLRVDLAPGDNAISFTTNRAPTILPNGDSRALAVAIADLHLRPETRF